MTRYYMKRKQFHSIDVEAVNGREAIEIIRRAIGDKVAGEIEVFGLEVRE